jgi:hypothetical protein
VGKWEEAAVDQLPAAEVKAHLARYAASFREVEAGTRCKRCEWASAPASGPDAVAEITGAVQGHREVARFLALRAKLELAEKRFDDAAHTLRVGIQYGKHIAEGPSLIQMLVGLAVTNVFLSMADEFVGQPGAPGLYWAVSALPRPLIDPRPGLDGEDALNESFLPGLAELRKGPVAAERALDVVGTAVNVLAAANEEANPFAAFGTRLGLTGYAALHHADAKKELIARGRAAKDVDAMPAVQAVFLNSFEVYRELADDRRKCFLLPHPEAVEGMAKAAEREKRVRQDRKGDVLVQVFLLVLPAVEKVHGAWARTDRKVAMLRAVEAIRVHADATGKLPRELGEVKKVPVPDDPLTGKPFGYALDGAAAVLTAPPVGTPPQKGLELRYELKLRPGK